MCERFERVDECSQCGDEACVCRLVCPECNGWIDKCSCGDVDIVERCRWDKRYTNGHVPVTLDDAANEIERSRQLVSALTTERNKLREAGKNIIKVLAVNDRNQARGSFNVMQAVEKMEEAVKEL